MREIKFRLLNEDNKIVGYEKWYCGAYNSPSMKDYFVAIPRWLYGKDNKYWNPEFIRHVNKQQFTGLTDKNGVEIYEGDVFNLGDIKIIYVIEHEDCYFIGRQIEHESTIGLKYWGKEIEIIGNIYENPDLLK